MRNGHKCLLGFLAAIGAAGGATFPGSNAEAGGFAIREQSTYFQGSAFAGNAAGGALSSMFWNPAAVGQFNGMTSESSYSLIIPDSEITALPGSTGLGLGLPANSGQIGNTAALSASYFSYQLSPSLVAGLSFGTPFGLSTEPENRFWAGQTHARTSKIVSYNLQTALAWRMSPTLIVGAGLQVQYLEGTLKSASGFAATDPNAVIKADDVALGFTAGILWHPVAGTSLGLGYRSSIDHNLEGSLSLSGVPGSSSSIEAPIETPDMLTLSLRQALTPRLTGLATVEWSNWSRLDRLDIVCQSPGGGFCGAPGSVPVTLPLGWHDGWLFALGGEYAWSPELTLRAGAAYELSPIQEADERPARLPDTDRIWASIGASYKWSEKITVDVAYTHIFSDDARIERNDGGTLIAEAESSVDILSVGLRMRLGDDSPPLK